MPEHRRRFSPQAELDRLVQSLGVPVWRTSETYDSLVRAAALVA